MPDPTRQTISEPGIYLDFPVADYFADPCPEPSLTQSLAKILLDRSPLHAWCAHPRFNPDFVPDDDTKFDVGNIAHAMMIGRGKDIVLIEYDDWRTKAAREARDEAAAAGKLAVLGKHFMRAQRMVDKAREALMAVGWETLDAEAGDGEVVLAWRERGFWCRSMVDWLSHHRRLICDYKTTGIAFAPHNIGRIMVDAGWDIQAAMIERGLDSLDPERAGKRKFVFLVQEDKPPHAAMVCELSESVLTMGRKKLNAAMHVWSDCLARDRWPGFATGIVRPEYPGYAESQWLEREINEFGDLTLLDAG